MHNIHNGMPARHLHELPGVRWQRSRRSLLPGHCVELAKLPNGEVAIRNSRFPDGPALVYTRAEIDAFLLGAKDGDFDNLVHQIDQ